MCVWRNLVSQILRSHLLFLYLRILGKGLQLKTTVLLVYLLWKIKFRFVDHLDKYVSFFLIFSMVLGLLNQLQIF